MGNKMEKKFQDQFLDEMLMEAGFDEEDLDLPKEDLKPLLQERILMHTYQILNEEQVAKVTKFLDEDKIEELNTYLSDLIPNYDDFLMEIYAQFKDEYLEKMGK